jgi:hypothetical protein
VVGHQFPNQQPGADLDGWALFVIVGNYLADETIHIGRLFRYTNVRYMPESGHWSNITVNDR